MKIKLTIFIALILLVLGAFYFRKPKAPVSASELVGKYTLDCDLVHEDLILYANGTFSQSILIKVTNELFVSNGTSGISIHSCQRIEQ